MRSFTLALATTLGLLAASNAQAGISLAFNGDAGSTIQFAGTGTSSTVTLQPQTTPQFTVNFEAGNGLDISGFGVKGSIIGSGFTFQANQIILSNAGLTQTAPLTGTGTLTLIAPGGGETLTATMTGGLISTTIGVGGINAMQTINLSNLVLTGSGNAALTTLNNQATSTGGVARLSFTFTTFPPTTLQDLTANGTFTTSYSGTLAAAVPEPATVVMAFSVLPLIGLGLWRRRRGVRA